MNLHTLLRGKTALADGSCAAACSRIQFGTVAPPVILQIDLTNNVVYFRTPQTFPSMRRIPTSPLQQPSAKFLQG
jgi:hypothetical protein